MLVATGAALCLALAGCRTSGRRAAEPRDNFISAYRAAEEKKLDSRTFELLSAAADRVVGYERRLARLKSAEKEDFGRFGAADDPRFVWAHDAECCMHLALAADKTPAPDPEPEMRKVAGKLLEFEQFVAWARLAACREAPRGDAELEAALLALRISTGWSEERILDFDFDSLPSPPEAITTSFVMRSGPAEYGAELVRATEALLALATKSPRPEEREIEAALDRVRRARRDLAQSYLRRAQSELGPERSEAAVAAWRIAAARYELEEVFPGW
jgi:hypothetical protein